MDDVVVHVFVISCEVFEGVICSKVGCLGRYLFFWEKFFWLMCFPKFFLLEI